MVRLFGSRAFYYIPKVERDKLDSKIQEGNFVGIPSGQNGYLIRLANRKLIASRDMKF